jgi:epoxyqueuosine reductase
MDLKEMSEIRAAECITKEMQEYARTSTENRLPYDKNHFFFDEPLVRFADGDDRLFNEFKTIIAPTHITPREALSNAYHKRPEELPERISVISWILPIAEATRKTNRVETKRPTRLWSHTRWYGEFFNDALRRHIVGLLKGNGFMAVAPVLEPYWSRLEDKNTGQYSNYSERHVAYVAGQGTFSLSDGFISERGIAHRCGSVVTSLKLPVSERKATGPYSNCLFYADESCKTCITRCPCGAITEKGHDKIKCQHYMRVEIGDLLREYDVGIGGCGLCQTKVPCEDKNPVIK